jgi:hypothetical protein
MGIFAGKCDNADMGLLTCAQKRYILGTNSEIMKIFAKG